MREMVLGQAMRMGRDVRAEGNLGAMLIRWILLEWREAFSNAQCRILLRKMMGQRMLMYPIWLPQTFVTRGKIEALTDEKSRQISLPSRSQLQLSADALRISFFCGRLYAKNTQQAPFLLYLISIRWNMFGAIDSDLIL
jgi:hypothetical protein